MRSVRELCGWHIGAMDGDIGHVADLYFDDRRLAVRHVVVETGSWPLGRRVLIAPQALGDVDAGGRRVRVKLTRQEVALSPDADEARPVSQQHELELSHYYGFPSYAVAAAASVIVASDPMLAGESTVGGDRHLRSARETTGYYVHALDDDVGRVDDWLLDDRSWTIRYLIDSVGAWRPTRMVLVPTGWVTGVSWGARAVRVSLHAETIRLGPGYDQDSGLSSEQETRVGRYYGPAPFDSD